MEKPPRLSNEPPFLMGGPSKFVDEHKSCQARDSLTMTPSTDLRDSKGIGKFLTRSSTPPNLNRGSLPKKPFLSRFTAIHSAFMNRLPRPSSKPPKEETVVDELTPYDIRRHLTDHIILKSPDWTSEGIEAQDRSAGQFGKDMLAPEVTVSTSRNLLLERRQSSVDVQARQGSSDSKLDDVLSCANARTPPTIDSVKKSEPLKYSSTCKKIASDLLDTTRQFTTNVIEARRLRSLKLSLLDDDERVWIDEIINNTEDVLRTNTELIDNARNSESKEEGINIWYRRMCINTFP